MQQRTAVGCPQRFLMAFVVLGISQMFINRNLSYYNPTNYYSNRTPLDSIINSQQEHQQEPKDAPIWSAFSRQNHKNTTEFDSLLRWKEPERRNFRRNTIEALTYGISGAFPWYSRILPAVRFDLPYQKTSQLEIAIVEGIVDAIFEMGQCTDGRKYENLTEPDGYYDACFIANSPDGKINRTRFENFCYDNFQNFENKVRLHDYPAPGHERWSCNDTNVMEQYVGAQIFDYLIGHYDRFYKKGAHNLFFFPEERPITLVSIDHDDHHYFNQLFVGYGHNKYTKYVETKWLLRHDMPLQLRDEIRDVVLLGKDEFVNRVNATLQGQLDNFNMIAVKTYKKRYGKDPPFVTDVIWNRLQNVVDYYNITIDY